MYSSRVTWPIKSVKLTQVGVENFTALISKSKTDLELSLVDCLANINIGPFSLQDRFQSMKCHSPLMIKKVRVLLGFHDNDHHYD